MSFPHNKGKLPSSSRSIVEALPPTGRPSPKDTGSNAFRVPAMLLPLAANFSPEQAMIVKESLPSTALDIANLIGLPATLALVEEFGGNELRIPVDRNGKAAELCQRISNAIGEKAALSILETYGGDVLYIPCCTKTRRMLRDMEIVRTYDALILEGSGRNAVSILAKKFFLSCRGVEMIVSRPAFSVDSKS